MKDALLGICIVVEIVLVGYMVLYPYFSLVNLKDIAKELEKIRKVIEDEKVTK